MQEVLVELINLYVKTIGPYTQRYMQEVLIELVNLYVNTYHRPHTLNATHVSLDYSTNRAGSRDPASKSVVRWGDLI